MTARRHRLLSCVRAFEPDGPVFRANAAHIWRAVAAPGPGGRFANVEGGSIEQQRDRRLQLHHVANYAASLTLLGELPGSARLLELGCGSGVLSRGLARSMPPGWALTAVDYSADHVQRARRYAVEAKLEFGQLDLRVIEPRAVNGFDAVLMLEVIEHLAPSEAAQLLGRLHAGLSAGGRLVFSTLDRSAFPRPFSGYGPHRVEYSCATLLERLSDAAFNPFERWRLYRLVSADITAAAVRSENRGGYLANRVAAWLERFPPTRQALRAAVDLGYRLYSTLPAADFDVEEAIAGLSLVSDVSERYDRQSFSIVALLEKE